MKNIEPNPPAEMSASARAAEIVAILATAIVRAQLIEGQERREVGLAFLPDQSVHTTPYQRERW